MPPLPRALAAPAILHKPKGSDVAWNGHLGPRRFSPQAHGPWEPSGVTCREQEPLTSFVLPWGEALGRKRGGERKKKKASLCITHVHRSTRFSRFWPQPLAGATVAVYSQGGSPCMGCPSCRTPHSSWPPLLQPVPLPQDTEGSRGTEPRGL